MFNYRKKETDFRGFASPALRTAPLRSALLPTALLGITLLGAALSLSACGQTGTTGTVQTEAGGSSEQEAETIITGNGSSVTVEGSGASVEGSIVTITAAGTYRLSGTVEDGQIRVDAGKEDEVRLILDGFSIANSTTSPVYGIQSGRITLVLEENTENTVSDASDYTYETEGEDEPDAAIFSKDDLVLEGKGTLTVNGNYQDAVRGKDDVSFASGTYILTAVNDGIKGRDSVEIEGGTFTITAGGDGIQSNNDEEEEKGNVRISDGSFTISAGKKGILAVTKVELNGGTFQVEAEDDAVHCNGDVLVNGGTCTLSSGDDAIHADRNVTVGDGKIHILKSYEGIEGLSIDINGGDITLTAEDDGLNAAGGTDSSGKGGRFGGDPFSSTEGAYIRIAGGTLRINAGGDGIDSNGDLSMEGGAVYVEGPEDDRNATVDYNGTGVITGGTFLGTGSSGMLQAFGENSAQNVLVLYYDETQAAGTEITITDAEGNELGQTVPSKEFSSLIFSSPELEDGAAYQVTTGEDVVEFTVDGVVNQYGTASGGHGDGGFRAGGFRAGDSRPGDFRSGDSGGGDSGAGDSGAGDFEAGDSGFGGPKGERKPMENGEQAGGGPMRRNRLEGENQAGSTGLMGNEKTVEEE